MGKRVSELGESVIQARTTESAYGSLMKFTDPEGNKFGCYKVRR
jgi:predicted enzyme related to lactoylglutathione lyase